MASNQYTILGTRWFNSRRGKIGVVAFEHSGGWAASIGIVDTSFSEEYMIQDIAEWGTLLLPEEGHAFFPHLESTTYNTNT